MNGRISGIHSTGFGKEGDNLMMNISPPSNRREAPARPAHRAGIDFHVIEAGLWEEQSRGPQAPGERTPVDEVAHDFNNILYTIKGFTELALHGVLKDTKPYDHLMMVCEAADQGARLVTQMLARSRQAASPKIPIDVRPIVEQTMRLVGAAVPESVSVRLTMSEEMGPVLADATEIRQLLINLCSNAAHSMEDSGGQLDVELSRVELDNIARALHPDLQPGPYLRLTVSDTGGGIEPHAADRIFEPYFTTKKQGHGTGLGLSVVRRIVKAHRGAITFETTVGRGTIFRTFFPTIECASPTCPVIRSTSFTAVRKESGMGLLKDDLQHLRTDMEHVHSDIEHLEKDLTQCLVECGPYLSGLRAHVGDLDAHLHDVLSHVMHVEEHSRSLELASEATKEG